MDEKALIERSMTGDAEAFATLAGNYGREIFTFIYRMTGNIQDAEDIAQQCFAKAFTAMASFRGDSSLRTWLYRIASNECSTFIRRRRPVDEITDNTAPLGDDGRDSVGPADLIRTETIDAAAKAILSLPEKQRVVVTLRIYENLSYREIAEISGIPEESAKVNFHYGIGAIRRRLRENGLL